MSRRRGAREAAADRGEQEGAEALQEDGERWVDARRGEAKDCLDDLETKLTKEWGEIFKGKKALNL